jgi:RNA polymerase sigma factor (sigma-70 family)
MTAEFVSQLEALHLDAVGWAVHCCHGEVQQAEDVLQTAYLKVVSGRAQFAGDSTLKTWWFGVIRYTAIEEGRRRSRRQSLLGRLLFMTELEQARTASPTDEVVKKEAVDQLSALLCQLPARQAEVLHLVFYQNMSIAEAAAIMGVSIGSARQHYERAKARLRALLREAEEVTHER